MKQAISVNRLAMRLFNRLIENQEFYGVEVKKTESGVTIVDAGKTARGGFQAGKLITEICMGGCGKTKITYRDYGDLNLPSISVYTDHPAIATLGSQYAGWHIKDERYYAIASGPARALALKPKVIYEEIGYEDASDEAVVVLEAEKFPPVEVIDKIVSDCKVSHQNLNVILTPTTSLCGMTQVSGRIVETGIHKLRRLGLKPDLFMSACGTAPIAPVHPDFATAMARTNDAILYGGAVFYIVEYDDEEKLKEILKKAPSAASKSCGKPFLEIFKEARFDFYRIDPDLFAPAVLTVNNMKTGNTFTRGEINVKMLKESFGLQMSE